MGYVDVGAEVSGLEEVIRIALLTLPPLYSIVLCQNDPVAVLRHAFFVMYPVA